MKLPLIALVAVALIAATIAHGQPRSGLPLDLDYGMSKPKVEAHLVAMAMYRLPNDPNGEVSYVIPDPGTNTTTGLYLKFGNGGLEEIASMKSQMSKQLYNVYLNKLVGKSREWVEAGMTPVVEDKKNNFYIYRDQRSYVTISGKPESKAKLGHSVTITFFERRAYESRHPGTRQQEAKE